MLRSLFAIGLVAVTSVSAINLGTVAGFPVPDLSKIQLKARAPVAQPVQPYIAGFPIPQV